MPIAPADQISYLVSLNIQTLKLAPLLARFLYTHKKLDLPGIGSFTLDSSASEEADTGKYPSSFSEGIRFESNSSTAESPELVSFISSSTGKMKALAAADLNSHLELAQQFLNIGKPFLFEGIGTLTKLQAGEFSFTAGEIMPGKLKEIAAKESSAQSTSEESYEDYTNLSKTKSGSQSWNKPLIAFLVLAGIGIAIWGGYTLYKNNQKDSADVKTETVKEDETIPVTQPVEESSNPVDSSTIITVPQPPAITAAPPGNYKFIVEVARQQRAVERLNKLKGFGLDVKMETADSVNYKLFFLLPASPADTARIRDSLRFIYTPAWGKAFVEQ